MDYSSTRLLGLAAVMMTLAGAGWADDGVTLVTLADNLMTGYGVGADRTFPVRIGKALGDDGLPVTIMNPGYQETSQDALFWLMPKEGKVPFVTIPGRFALILIVGNNDCVAYPYAKLPETKANLDHILALLKARKVAVLVVGTQAQKPCGEDYGRDYPQVFADLAAEYGDLYYADFLDGLIGHPDLLLRDGEHPNAAGEAVAVARMLPMVKALVAQVGK